MLVLGVNSANYRNVAQRLGLGFDGRGCLSGVIEQVPVVVSRSASRDKSLGEEIIYSAILPSAAPISFTLEEKTLSDKMGEFFHGLVSKASLHDELDEHFAFHAADPARAAALFDDESRAILRRVAWEKMHPLVTPQMLSFRVYSFSLMRDEESRIEHTLKQLVLAVHTLSRSFAMSAAGVAGYR